MDINTTKFDKESKLWRSAEEVNPPELGIIHGHIPDWLNGTYIRVGPGKFDLGNDFSVTHLYDGYALLSKFSINKNVTFETKYLNTTAYERAESLQRPGFPEFGTGASQTSKKGFFSRFIGEMVPENTDNTNHAFFCLNEHLFATNDAGCMWEVDKESLSCIYKVDPVKTFGLKISTAHPLLDPETNNCYNVGICAELTGLKYNFIVIPPKCPELESEEAIKDQFARSKILCTISSQWTSCTSFNHSFGMTKHFLIMIEQPLVLNIKKLVTSSLRRKEEAFRDWLEWKNDALNRIHIVEKRSGRLVTKNLTVVTTIGFFFLHFINCYEDHESNEIVLDLSAYNDASILLGDSLTINHLRSSNNGTSDCDDAKVCSRPMRIRIPLFSLGFQLNANNLIEEIYSSGAHEKLATNRIEIEPIYLLDSYGLELISINKSFQGKSYKYMYGTGLISNGCFRNSISKFNVQTNEITTIRINPSQIFGEVLFVQEDGSTEEDDGIVIVPMTDASKMESDFLYFYSAKDMTELGSVTFKNCIPPAMHAIFVATKN